MTPYINITSDNSINCNVDFIITSGRELIMASICDYAIKNKKLCSDLIGNKYCGINLKDREDATFSEYISKDENRFRFKSEKMDCDLTHTIIYNTNINNYAIDWNNEGKTKVITKYLRNIHYLPVTEELVQKVNEYIDKVDKEDRIKYPHSYSSYDAYITECEVYSNNPIYKNIKCYDIKVDRFKTALDNIELFSKKSDFDWNTIEDIGDYLFTFLNPIKDKLNENINTLYNPNKINPYIFEGKIKPYKGQIPIIQAGLEVLKRDRFVYLAAEQGLGKTNMGIKINNSYFNSKGKSNYITLIVAPAITLSQWKEEIKLSIDDKADIIIIKKTSEFIIWYNKTHMQVNKPTYLIVGKETFKLMYKKKAGVNIQTRKINHRKEVENRWSRYGGKEVKDISENISIACCPDCGLPLQNKLIKKEDLFFTEKDFKGNPKKSNYRCSNCGSILWQAMYDKTKKTSIIDFIKRKHIQFDSVICDEIHESNNSSSIISNATRSLFKHTKKIILLSGTSNNGYSSSLHSLLVGLIPNTLIKNNVMDIKDFIKEYGTLMAISKKKDGEYYSRGRSEIKDSDFKEIEGINPIVFTKFLCQNYIFATLDDLGNDLPPLNEYYIPIKQNDNIARSSSNIFDEIKSCNAFNAKMYLDSVIKHYINNPFNWDSLTIHNGDKGDKIVQPMNYSDMILPKELELIKIVKQELAEGRKCWIYVNFNNGGEYMKGECLPNRIERLLKEEGITPFQLKPSVKTYDRKDLIDKKKNDYDVFISNPKLVQVGLNLTFCPTYINYMPSYMVNEVSQSNRRGYRANSTLENRIYHLYYENTIENDIMKRYERKLVESKAIVGVFDVEIEDDKDIRTASKLGTKINDSIK